MHEQNSREINIMGLHAKMQQRSQSGHMTLAMLVVMYKIITANTLTIS